MSLAHGGPQPGPRSILVYTQRRVVAHWSHHDSESCCNAAVRSCPTSRERKSHSAENAFERVACLLPRPDPVVLLSQCILAVLSDSGRGLPSDASGDGAVSRVFSFLRGLYGKVPNLTNEKDAGDEGRLHAACCRLDNMDYFSSCFQVHITVPGELSTSIHHKLVSSPTPMAD